MLIIASFTASCVAIVLSVASIWNSNRLRLQFSRNKLKKEILSVRDDVEYLSKQLSRDWDDTYEKLRSIAGRIDRAKRKGNHASPLDEMNEGPQPGDAHQQILNIARQRGMV